MSKEVMQQAQLLCEWIAETPHQRGSINGLAAQVLHSISAALAAPQPEKRFTGLILSEHRDPMNGASIPNPFKFGAAPQPAQKPVEPSQMRKSQMEHELEAMKRYIEKITKDKSSAVGFLARAGILDSSGLLAEQYRNIEASHPAPQPAPASLDTLRLKYSDEIYSVNPKLAAQFEADISAIAAPQPAQDQGLIATLAGLEASTGHLSAIVDQQRSLLAEVDDVFGRDERGIPFEDGESRLIDKVRAHLAGIAAPQAPQPRSLGALAKRRIFDAIRGAYDLGYNDARNARTTPGDSAPGYKGRDVEADHGGALLSALNQQLAHGITKGPAA